MSNEPLVGMFMKIPRPGEVKTRLGQEIGMRVAARFYAECLAMIYYRLRRNGIRPVVFVKNKVNKDWVKKAFEFKDERRIFGQVGDNLGQRMFNALELLTNQFDGAPMIIGTDAPLLPIDYLYEAGNSMQDDRVVLGPSPDGGYYLIGTRVPRVMIFENIEWSQPDVLERTLDRIKNCNLGSYLLPAWNDIDTVEDLLEKSNYDNE